MNTETATAGAIRAGATIGGTAVIRGSRELVRS